MATATRHATMLREIATARDEHRSGALDVEWDGACASLFFVFGQPSHATFESSDGRDLAGAGALSALVEELPLDFSIARWRRIMVTEDTLRCTVNELVLLFGGDADEPARDTAPPTGGHRSTGPAPAATPPPPPLAARRAVPFGVRDFPLLPLGPSLWSDAAANVVHLEALVPRLPNSLIVLTGPTRRAAALIADGSIVDAVWVDEETGLLGEDAAHALMSVADGMVSGYRIDDVRLVAAIPMLWRAPRLPGTLPARWLDAEDVVAEVRSGGRSCALLVDGAEPGAALFHDGELVAVYTAQRRRPATTTALRSLLHGPGARATVVGCTDADERALELNDESFHLFIAREDAPAAPAAGDPEPGAVAPPPRVRPPVFALAEAVEAQAPPPFAAVADVRSSDPAEPAGVDAVPPPPREFVAARLDIDIDALRTELIEIAAVWLGDGDAAAVAATIRAARPGVDDFVAAIAAIAAMDVRGHDRAVVRAMAREMHFRAAEVLCGV